MVTRVVHSVVGMTTAPVANPEDHATATQTAPASTGIIGLPVRAIQHGPAAATTGTINHALNVMTVRVDRRIDPDSAVVTGLRVQVHDETRTLAQTATEATIVTGMSGHLGRATVLIPTAVAQIRLVAQRVLHLTGTAMLIPAPGSTATINPGSSVETAAQDVATTGPDSSVTMSVPALTGTTSLAEQAHVMATHVLASNAGTTRSGDPAAMPRGHGPLIGMSGATAVRVSNGPVLRAIATIVINQVGHAGQMNEPVGLTAPVAGRHQRRIASGAWAVLALRPIIETAKTGLNQTSATDVVIPNNVTIHRLTLIRAMPDLPQHSVKTQANAERAFSSKHPITNWSSAGNGQPAKRVSQEPLNEATDPSPGDVLMLVNRIATGTKNQKVNLLATQIRPD
ncbi:MAG: hypothetical protein JWP57_2505 [Spirosoma sp.]|nr:hypothetical protein [Spirosoma sp.]